MESTLQNLEKLVEKEIEKVKKILDNIISVDLKAKEVFILVNSYFNDSIYFFNKKDFLNSFEAIVITWSYLDCLAHLELIKFNKYIERLFTI